MLFMVTESTETALIHLPNTQALNIQTISPYSSNWCIESLINTFGKMQTATDHVYVLAVVQLLSSAWLFATPWTAAHQTRLSFTISKFGQIHFQLVGGAIQSSIFWLGFSSCPQYFPPSESFLMSWLFVLGGQSTGASVSISVLPVNIQGWLPLGFDLLTV